MLILAADTSGSNCSVALMKDQALLGEYNMNFGKQHSILLMPMIEELMDKTGVQPQELTHLAINLGPGSFTGLRIGLSVLEAMAYALEIPLYGYSSFEAAAEPLRNHDRDILILHDALKKTFYSQAFHHIGNHLKESLSPDVRNLEELQQLFPKGTNLVIAGDGLVKFKQDIAQAFPNARLVEDSTIARASSLARLCQADVNNNIPPGDVSIPRYMRKPQAQREYEAKHGHDLNP